MWLSHRGARVRIGTHGRLRITYDGGLHWSLPRAAITTQGGADLPIDNHWVAVDNNSTCGVVLKSPVLPILHPYSRIMYE